MLILLGIVRKGIFMKKTNNNINNTDSANKSRPAAAKSPERPAKAAPSKAPSTKTAPAKAPSARPAPSKTAKSPAGKGSSAGGIKVKHTSKRRSSKKVLLVFAIILAVVAIALTGGYFYLKMSGYKGTYGECKWELTKDGILTISGNGSMVGERKVTFGLGEPDMSIVREINVGEGVTDFTLILTKEMSNLQKLSLPSTVVTIGTGVLNDSTSLQEISVSNDNKEFASMDGSLYTKDGTQLIVYASGRADTEFTVPETVETISSKAFANSTNLTKLTLDANLLSIERQAFDGCNNISEFVVDSKNEFYSSEDGIIYDKLENELVRYAPAKDFKKFDAPPTVSRIHDGAFENAVNLTEVTLSERTKYIGSSAFYGCSNLETLNLPNPVSNIGQGAFALCSKLSSFTLSQNMINIPANLFWGCESLTTIELPTELVTIGDGAFARTGLTSVMLPDTVTDIGKNAFGGCKNLSSVVISINVVTIPDYAFNGCTSLSEVTIPDGVTTIGYSAFADCTAIKNITIPENVEFIRDYAFFNCTALSSVNLGSRVNVIGYAAFNNCPALLGVKYEPGQAGLEKINIGDQNSALTKALKAA